MQVLDMKILKFDGQFPIYNWLYPLGSDGSEAVVSWKQYQFPETNEKQGANSRALYLHVL